MKRYNTHLGKRLFWHYHLQQSLFYITMSQIYFNLFRSRNKRFLSVFMRKWGWFQRHDVRFPKKSQLKIKISTNLRHDFEDERAMIATTLISSCHWKTLVPSCLQKKRPENTFMFSFKSMYHVLHVKVYIVMYSRFFWM